MQKPHTSVLKEETIKALNAKENGIYIDATAGAGGHSIEIAKKGATIICIDQDEVALKLVREKLEGHKAHFILGNFKDLQELLLKEDHTGPFDGILFDLGVSSMQLDTKERGFSFQKDAPLDMRMSASNPLTAKEVVNTYEENELYRIFKKFGGEEKARKIAQSIVGEREKKPIETTGELAELISSIKGGKRASLHPATKVFQAIRIEVNQELYAIETALPQALRVLKTGGRLAVISFHEGEDRIVKNLFNTFKKESKIKIITAKPVTPTKKEVAENIRARSAKLRVAEKV